MKSNKFLMILATFIILILTISVVSTGFANIIPKDTSIDVKINDSHDYVTAILKEDTNPLANQSITFSIEKEGKIINKTLVTDKEGIAKLDISSLESGKYNVTVLFKGNEEYKNSSNYTDFEIFKIKTTLKLSNDDLISIGLFDEYSKEMPHKDISVIVKDSNNKVVKNKVITTDSYGIAYMNISGLKNGNYKIIALFKGDNYYESSSNYIKVDIHNKLYTYIQIIPNLFSNKYISAILFDENKKGIENKALTFTIIDKNGTIVMNTSANTDKDGLAYIDVSKINLTNCYVYVSFDGDNNYYDSEDVFSFNIEDYEDSTPQSANAAIDGGLLAYLLGALGGISSFLNNLGSQITSFINSLISGISGLINGIFNSILSLTIDIIKFIGALLGISVIGLITNIVALIAIISIVAVVIVIILVIVILYLFRRSKSN